MEEQKTESEYKVESDEQLLHEDLFFFSLSLLVPCPTHPPLAFSFSSAHSVSLSFNYFVVDIIFGRGFFVCVVSNCLHLRSITFCFVYIALLHAILLINLILQL